MQDAAYQSLHGEIDQKNNDTRINRMLGIFGIAALIALALIIVSLIWRDSSHMNNPNEMASQIITIAITLVVGSLIVFFWGMKLTPLLCYRKYLKEITRGLSRTVEGVVVRFDEGTTFRDGLFFYAMIVNIGDLKEPEDERLLYYDARIARPDIREGDTVRFQAHGNDIIGTKT